MSPAASKNNRTKPPPPQFSDSPFPKGMSIADLPNQIWVPPRYAALEPASDPLRGRQPTYRDRGDRPLAQHSLLRENGVSELNPKYALGLALRPQSFRQCVLPRRGLLSPDGLGPRIGKPLKYAVTLIGLLRRAGTGSLRWGAREHSSRGLPRARGGPLSHKR